MTIDTIVNIPGNLRDAYNAAVPGTVLHVDQLTSERRSNPELRNLWFYTADGELYQAEKKKTLWVITREPQNLVLQNIDEAYRQLTQEGNYIPNGEAAAAAIAHADSVVIDLKGLIEVKDSDEYGHFNVNPRKVKKLNSQKRMAALRIFGPDEENFGLNMEMFAEAGISPDVYTLLPSYVQAISKQKGSKCVGRASWLNDFINGSNFNAGGRGIYYYVRVRGVRQVVAAGDALKNEVPQAPQEIITPVRCYETLLADETSAVAALNDVRAAGLSRLLAGYLATKAQ